MLLKIKNPENYERVVQLLELAGIEVEEVAGNEFNPKLKEALVYEDCKYYFECPYCGHDETYEPRDFAEMFDRETYQVQCHCGEVSIVDFCKGEMIEK